MSDKRRARIIELQAAHGAQVVGQEFRHDDGTADELSFGHKYFSPSEFPTRLPRFSNDSEAAGIFTLSLERPYFA